MDNSVYIFYNYFLPAYRAGGPIQSLSNIIQHLSQEPSIQFSLITTNEDYGGHYLDVKADEWQYYQGKRIIYLSKPKRKLSTLKTLVSNPNKAVLYFNNIYSPLFFLLPFLFFRRHRKILATRGMLDPEGLKQKVLKKTVYLLLLKLFRVKYKCEFHATTIEEKSYIQKVFGNTARIWVVSNLSRSINYASPVPKIPSTLKMVSVALISEMKNHLLVLQSLKNCKYNIEYSIYGAIKNIAYWQDCLQAIDELPANIHVIYKGEIEPAKVEIALAEAHIKILPSKSENFGHAILEALMVGRPVITSYNTPWKYLKEKKAGINIGSEQELRNAIDFFAQMDLHTLEQWSLQARAYALAAMDIEKVKAEYRQMFTSSL